MQALFSALELLGRSAKSGASAVRVERACDLARRAIDQHEKSTLDVLQLLTLQHTAPASTEISGLLNEVTHFLRNDAANRSITIIGPSSANLTISVERACLQTVLVGLMTTAIDGATAGSELRVSAERRNEEAVITIESDADYGDMPSSPNALLTDANLSSRDITLLFANQFLAQNGARFGIESEALSRTALCLYFPCLPAPQATPV